MAKPDLKKKVKSLKTTKVDALAKARAARKAGGTTKRKSKKVNLRPVKNLEEGSFNVLVTSPNSVIELEGTLLALTSEFVTISHKKARSKLFMTRNIPTKDIIVVNGEVGDDTAKVMFFGTKAIYAAAGEFSVDKQSGLFKINTIDGHAAYVNAKANVIIDISAEEAEGGAPKKKKKKK